MGNRVGGFFEQKGAKVAKSGWVSVRDLVGTGDQEDKRRTGLGNRVGGFFEQKGAKVAKSGLGVGSGLCWNWRRGGLGWGDEGGGTGLVFFAGGEGGVGVFVYSCGKFVNGIGGMGWIWSWFENLWGDDALIC